MCNSIIHKCHYETGYWCHLALQNICQVKMQMGFFFHLEIIIFGIDILIGG